MRVLYIIIYVTMLFFGLVENIKGVAFPLIKTEFGVPYNQQGELVSLAWFGYVAFCLIASLFLSRFGIKKAILAGYLLVCIGAAATMVAPTFWAASLALVVVNAGFGFFEVGTNAMATAVFTVRAALMMNLMHFFYGFGAILGPPLAGFLTDAFSFNWRQVYITVMLPVAIMFFIILMTKFATYTDAGETMNSGVVSFKSAFKNPLMWLFSATLGFMEVIEFGAANWGGLYLQDVYGLDPRIIGAGFVSLFYVLFTISRLFSGLVIEKVGYIKSLQLAVMSTLILFTIGFGAGRYGVWVLPVTGLFIAIMWPTIMAVAMQVFGADTPVITSAVITISGAINGVFQLVIGFTNHFAGYAWGYRSCVLYTVFALVALRLLSKRVHGMTEHAGTRRER